MKRMYKMLIYFLAALISLVGGIFLFNKNKTINKVKAGAPQKKPSCSELSFEKYSYCGEWDYTPNKHCHRWYVHCGDDDSGDAINMNYKEINE